MNENQLCIVEVLKHCAAGILNNSRHKLLNLFKWKIREYNNLLPSSPIPSGKRSSWIQIKQI